MKQVILSDDRVEGEMEPILNALKPTALFRSYVGHWATLAAIAGVGSMLASDKPWSQFEPSAHWVMVVVLGTGVGAIASPVLKSWTRRRYLTSTNTEIKEQLEKQWSTLTGAKWPTRVIRIAVAASIVFGGVMGTLFSVLFPGERLSGSTLGTIGGMAAAFLVPILAMAFGIRGMMVRLILRRVGPDGVLPRENS